MGATIGLGIVVILIGWVLVAKGGKSQDTQLARYEPGNWRGNQPQPLIESRHPPEPEGPAYKYVLYGAGGIACFAGLLMALHMSLLTLLSPFVIWGGVALIRLGLKADETHAANMKARAEAEVQHTRLEAARIQTENARREAERQAQLNVLRDNAERERLEADRLAHIQKQRDISYQETLRPAAQEYGIDIPSVIAINTKRILDQLDLEQKAGLDTLEIEKEWRQIQNELKAGDQLMLAGNQQVKQLYTDLTEAVGNMIAVEQDGSIPDHAKAILRKSLSGQIKSLMRQMNEIQSGLHQAQDRKKPQGAKKPAAVGRGDYPPETDADADRV
jgi:hypothetical protein